MTDDIVNDAGPAHPLDGRHPDGRFAPGNNLGTPWGADNPPPRSPGRPKKGAWLRELEERVKDPHIRQGLADRLVKIALKGRDGDALRALQEIQNRTGEPIALRVDGMTREQLLVEFGEFMDFIIERLPQESRSLLIRIGREFFAAKERPPLLPEHRDG